jgi:hypothetical protein
MSRRFLDDVRAEIHAIIKTNGNAEITGPLLNGLMIDMIDSTIQDESVIASNIPSGPIPTTTTFTPLTTGIYDESSGGDGVFLKPDFINGEIISGATAGFSYTVRGLVSINDTQINRLVNFVILKNGVPAGFISQNVGRGNSKPISLSVEHYSLSTPSDTVYQIGVETPDGANTVDILSIGMSLTIQATNNP